MKIHVKKGDLAESATEAAVVAHFEGEPGLDGAAARLDKMSGGFIGDVIGQGDFTGRLYQILVIYSRGSVPAKRMVAVGLGKRSDLTLERLRGAFSKAAQHIRSLNIGEFATSLDLGSVALSIDRIAEAVVEGVRLGLYRFTPFKTAEREQIREIANFTILDTENGALKIIKAAVKTAGIIADAVSFARDIVSAPANEMTPADLANEAR
ncbi:MAG: leucyl aminopeptidase family protein [Proteobacteria bacterium]|nr:leucyl aminopeptidase family protein [Pseudomonadota bacterium]